MECCVCGQYCPPMTQWYNRDKGYTICRPCINQYGECRTSYGIEGIHYESQKNYDERTLTQVSTTKRLQKRF